MKEEERERAYLEGYAAGQRVIELRLRAVAKLRPTDDYRVHNALIEQADRIAMEHRK